MKMNIILKKITVKMLSAVTAAVMLSFPAQAASVLNDGWDTWDGDGSAEVTDNDVFRPYSAVSVKSAGAVDPDADGILGYTVKNNTPDTIRVSDISTAGLLRKEGTGWVSIIPMKDPFGNFTETELEPFEGYENDADISRIFGDLPDGDYCAQLCYSSSSDSFRSMNELSLEFSVKHTITSYIDDPVLMMPINKKKITLVVRNNAPFDTEMYFDESLTLEKLENGKWKELYQKEDAEWYYHTSVIRSGKGARIKLHLPTFFEDIEPGRYRLSFDWIAANERDIPREYRGSSSGTREIEFDVKGPVSAECVPSSVRSSEDPYLTLRMTNNTQNRLVIVGFGRVQLKYKSGNWKYLNFKSNRIKASDIKTRIVLRPGETDSVKIPLTDYYNKYNLIGKVCRAEISITGVKTYCYFSVKDSGGYITVD